MLTASEMMTDLCQELRNWFDRERIADTFTITGGVLSVSFLATDQYYRIIGSIFNDGVHKYGDNGDNLHDEVFTGEVWALGIPKAVVSQAEEIEAWRNKYETTEAMSPYVSESFGGYSYTKANSNGISDSWKSAFAGNLNRWRKI